MGSKKIETEKLPIIIENRNVGRVLNGFCTGDETAGPCNKNVLFSWTKKEKKMGSDLFTLVDDPHILEGMGSKLYDGDGLATKKRNMVENGILKDYYIDWYRSRKLGVEPTTGGTSNLLILRGNALLRR